MITAHQRYRQTDGRTSSDPMTATLLKHVAVKTKTERWRCVFYCFIFATTVIAVYTANYKKTRKTNKKRAPHMKMQHNTYAYSIGIHVKRTIISKVHSFQTNRTNNAHTYYCLTNNIIFSLDFNSLLKQE